MQNTPKNSRIDEKLGIGYMILAAVFIFNPTVNIVDILPDFFGYLLLVAGLSRWGDVSSGIADALVGLKRLRTVMLIKLVMMFFVSVLDDTYILFFTFGFAVIELIYLIPALGKLFGGFQYCGTRFGGRAVYANLKNVMAISYIFLIGKSVLNVIPELCSLSSFEYSGYVTSGVQIDFGRYKLFLLAVSVILTLLAGVLWLINIIGYLKGIGRDTAFLERVYAVYDSEVGSKPGILFSRRLRSALTLVTVGGIFLLNFWTDINEPRTEALQIDELISSGVTIMNGLNVIPSFIFGLFLLAAVILLSKYCKGTKFALIGAAVYTAISAVGYAVGFKFASEFKLEDIRYSFEAYDLYGFIRICTLIEGAVLVFALVKLYGLLVAVLREHLGFDPRANQREYEQRKNRELYVKLKASFALAMITVALTVALVIFRAEILAVLRGAWFIPLIVGGVWLFYQNGAFETLYDQIEFKYR